MSIHEQMINYIRNSFSRLRKTLDDKTIDKILPDIKAYFKQMIEINTVLMESEVNKKEPSELTDKDMKLVQDKIYDFEKVFYYKCSPEYFNADSSAIKLFEDYDNLDAKSKLLLIDDIIHSLSKCRHWMDRTLYIDQFNWKKRFSDFYEERIRTFTDLNKIKYDKNMVKMQSDALTEQWEGNFGSTVKFLFSK